MLHHLVAAVMSGETKTSDWEERGRICQEELVTLAETMQGLGSNHALYRINKASRNMALEQNAVELLHLPSGDPCAVADTNVLRKRGLSEVQHAHEGAGDHGDAINLITTAASHPLNLATVMCTAETGWRWIRGQD